VQEERYVVAGNDPVLAELASKTVGATVELSVGNGLVEMLRGNGKRILGRLLLECMMETGEWELAGLTVAKDFE